MNSNQMYLQAIKRSEPVLKALGNAGIGAAGVSLTPDGALHVRIEFPEWDLAPEVRRELNEVRRYEYMASDRLQPAGPEWADGPEEPAGMQHWTFTVRPGDTLGRAVKRAREDFERFPYSPVFTDHLSMFFDELRSELTARNRQPDRMQEPAAAAVCVR